MTAECPLTELPSDQCASPKHRGGTVLGADEVETVGRSFEALYAGGCERCERHIQPGDQILRCADDAGYVHERCPR
jgi:hypothetical protein